MSMPTEAGQQARWEKPDLRNRVALVCGASRGAGRGIALALGECGATVYVSGRTLRGGPPPFDGAPGTIDDTAEEVTRRGGRGVPVRCDHTVEADVAALFARIRDEHGRLDLLANGVWGSSRENYDQMFGDRKRPFWELGSVGWNEAMLGGAYAHLLASVYAARLMAPRGAGLIASVTEPADGFPGGASLFWMFTGLGHAVINRLAAAMSGALKSRAVAIVAVCPGFMRTERVMMHIEKLTEEQKRAFRFELSETTEYVGRAVASLAADSKALRWTGKTVHIGDLAEEYGFTDTDGRQPNFYREVLQKMSAGKKSKRSEKKR
jgi:NAD(P)-dependent dehydrogenase (short-subunit alcohol dehydrogenase family)